MAESAVARERVGWPDVAKGLCIVLVVLWHVVTKHALFVDDAGPVTAGWASLNALLLPLRMPLFFFVSGMFAGRVLTTSQGRPWRRRAGQLASLYLMWMLVQAFALAATPDFPTARPRDGWEFVAQLTISPTNLWYLLALAFYLLVGRMSKGVPTAVLLPVSFIISAVGSAGVLPDLGNLWQVFQNLFFFLAGLRLRGLAERLAARAGAVQVLVLGAGFLGATVLMTMLGMREWPGVWAVVSAIAVAAGVSASALIDRHLEVVARPMRWLGRRTLPIYVLHMLVIALIDSLMHDLIGATAPVWELLGPVILTAAVVVVCLMVHALLVRAGLRVLFDPLLLVDRLAAARVRVD